MSLRNMVEKCIYSLVKPLDLTPIPQSSSAASISTSPQPRDHFLTLHTSGPISSNYFCTISSKIRTELLSPSLPYKHTKRSFDYSLDHRLSSASYHHQDHAKNTNMSAFTMAQVTRNYEQNVAPTRTTSNNRSDEKAANWDAQSTAPTIAASETASIKGDPPALEKSTSRKVWEKVKKVAREHHESVNAAYQAHYNPGGFKYTVT